MPSTYDRMSAQRWFRRLCQARALFSPGWRQRTNEENRKTGMVLFTDHDSRWKPLYHGKCRLPSVVGFALDTKFGWMDEERAKVTTFYTTFWRLAAATRITIVKGCHSDRHLHDWLTLTLRSRGHCRARESYLSITLSWTRARLARPKAPKRRSCPSGSEHSNQ